MDGYVARAVLSLNRVDFVSAGQFSLPLVLFAPSVHIDAQSMGVPAG
jgi:hypothetical protein